MENQYTKSEIEQKVKDLDNEIYKLKLKRTELTQSINSLKKQIEAWQNLDKRQTKMF